MKTKKIIASMMVAAMATTLVAGCGSKGQESTESSTDSGSKKITIATWNEPNSDEALNMYAQCEKALGVDLEVTVIPESDYSSKLNQMVATKDDSIDIYIIWECDIANFAAADGILPLDDYLADSDIDTNDFIEAVNTLSDGLGGTYGLPWCAATEIMYYNQDMFDAAGIEYPSNDWSYEEYKAAAQK